MNDTTIVVDNTNGLDDWYKDPDMGGNVIQIGAERLVLLPLDSDEGELITFTDGRGKAVKVRVRYNL
jgi:hypothetical protein